MNFILGFIWRAYVCHFDGIESFFTNLVGKVPNISWTFFFKNDHFRYRRCRRLDRSLTVCWQTLLQIAILGLLQKQLLLSLLQSSFCLSATMKYLFTHNWLIDWNIHFSACMFVCLFVFEEWVSLLEWF